MIIIKADEKFKIMGYEKSVDDKGQVIYKKMSNLKIKINPKKVKSYISYKDEKGNWINKELPIESNELLAALEKMDEKGW